MTGKVLRPAEGSICNGRPEKRIRTGMFTFSLTVLTTSRERFAVSTIKASANEKEILAILDYLRLSNAIDFAGSSALSGSISTATDFLPILCQILQSFEKLHLFFFLLSNAP